MRRWRHHAALLALLCALVAIVGLHHAAPAIGDAHHDTDMGAVAELCLAVLTTVGAAVGAAGLALIALGRWSPAVLLGPSRLPATARPAQPPTRAGPAVLVLLCVSRR